MVQPPRLRIRVLKARGGRLGRNRRGAAAAQGKVSVKSGERGKALVSPG